MTSHSSARASTLTHAYRFEILTSRTVPDVELVADHRHPHRVCAIEQVTIFDRRVQGEIDGNHVSAASVPTRAVDTLGRRQSVRVRLGTGDAKRVTWFAGEHSPAAARRLRRRRNPPCASPRDPELPSATA